MSTIPDPNFPIPKPATMDLRVIVLNVLAVLAGAVNFFQWGSLTPPPGTEVTYATVLFVLPYLVPIITVVLEAWNHRHDKDVVDNYYAGLSAIQAEKSTPSDL